MKKALLFILLCLPLSIEAAQQTLYVTADGSGSTCSEGTPCTLSTALSTVADGDGDTIVLNSGAYTGGISLSDTTDHDNLTITTTAAVKSALTFSRGIASGTDNRPYFSGGTLTVANGVSGTTVEYIRLRAAASPSHNFFGVAEIYEFNTIVQYCEFWNGGAGVMFRTTKGPITISQCYVHDCGTTGDDPDDHAFTTWADVDDGNASSWDEKILVEYTTIGGAIGGDGYQAATADDFSRYDAYVEFSNCNFTAQFDEQMIDTKGLRYMKIHDCNFTGTTGYSADENGWVINTTYDDGEDRNSNLYWYIYNNYFSASSSGVLFIGGISSDWYIWNNVFYDNLKLSPYEGGSGTLYIFKLPGTATFVHNTMISNSKISSIAWGGLGLSSSSNVVRNNLFYNNAVGSEDHGNISTRDYSGGTITHNFVYPTSCSSDYCITGTDYKSENDVQVVSIGVDFTLQSSSICIDAGVELSDNGLFTPSIDASGNARDATPDLGAFEYNTEDTTAPEISTVALGTNGTTVTIGFSETVVTTASDDGDFNLDCATSGTNIAINSISGSGNSRTFTAASTVHRGDTCNCDYTGAANEIEDAAGNDLAAVNDKAVTNNSTANTAPNSIIDTPTEDTTITAGETVNFTGTGTDDDGDDMTYAWNFDGGASNSTSSDPGNVQFNTAGVYHVVFTVTDEFSLADPTPDTVTITVEEAAAPGHPAVSLGGPSAAVGSDKPLMSVGVE